MLLEAPSGLMPEHDLPLTGVSAAVLIPRTESGELDWQAFGAQLRFLQQHGIEGFAINGATGEYILTTEDDFRCLLQVARSVLGGRGRLVAGVGGGSIQQVQKLIQVALAEGADGLLLPMPYFFPYEQDDLSAFVGACSAGLRIPVYVYNLPSFTTPLKPATTLEIIRNNDSVVGIKDSSGSLETLTLLKRSTRGAACILGNDAVLHDALARDVCDGVVSGVACVLPELMLKLYKASASDAAASEALELKARLDEFIQWLNLFPVPWGLKIVAEARGLGQAWFPLPLSREKQRLRGAFLEWFESRRERLLVSSRD